MKRSHAESNVRRAGDEPRPCNCAMRITEMHLPLCARPMFVRRPYAVFVDKGYPVQLLQFNPYLYLHAHYLRVRHTGT